MKRVLLEIFGTRACQKFDFFARKGWFLFNSKHFYQENYDVMLTLDESSNYMKKSTSQNFHKRVLYDRKVTLKKLMWQQAFLPTEAIKVSEKINLISNFVWHLLLLSLYYSSLPINRIFDESKSIQPFVKLLLCGTLFTDLSAENSIEIPIR